MLQWTRRLRPISRRFCWEMRSIRRIECWKISFYFSLANSHRLQNVSPFTYHHLLAAVIHTVFAELHRSSKRVPIDLWTMLSVPYPVRNDFVLVAMQNPTQRLYGRQTSRLAHFVWNYSTKVDYSHRVPNVALWPSPNHRRMAVKKSKFRWSTKRICLELHIFRKYRVSCPPHRARRCDYSFRTSGIVDVEIFDGSILTSCCQMSLVIMTPVNSVYARQMRCYILDGTRAHSLIPNS